MTEDRRQKSEFGLTDSSAGLRTSLEDFCFARGESLIFYGVKMECEIAGVEDRWGLMYNPAMKNF